MKKFRLVSIVGLILVLLITAVPAFAADPNPGSGNTDVVVVNTNQNTGSPAATANALYYNPAGVVEYSRERSINPRGSYIFMASDTPLGDNWVGSMILQSDYELAAVAEVTWSDGSANDGITAGAYTGYAFGSTSMYLPFAVYAPDAQFTRVSVQNTEDAVASIRMEYVNRDGVTDATINDSIDGLGSKTYDLHVPGGQVPNLRNTAYFNANGFWGGAIKITSLNGREIAAVATNHWQNWAVAFNGAASGAERVFVPSVERRVSTTQGWRGFSVILVQCVESSGTCNVRIRYQNAQTGTTDLTLTRSLNAGAALGANTRNGGDWDFATFEPLGDAWVGSAIIDTTNSTDVSVVVYTIRPGTTLAGASAGASVADAGGETFMPAVYQKNTANVSCPPNPDLQWTQYSLLRIQNPTNNNANDVDVYFFNRNGTLAYQDLNNSIQAGKSTNLNTRVDCAQINLGGQWEGSVYVDADQPVVAVAQTLWGGVKMNEYNGYSVNR